MQQAPDTHALMDEILSRENLTRAWKRVHSNKGAPGIDGLRIDEFAAYFRAHGPTILAALHRGDYRPYPVRRVYIDKEDGSQRGLGIPTVLDRVIQQAIAQVLSPIFEATFSEYSYGFRPKRSQHQAVTQVQTYVAQGRKIAVDVDLSKFFDRVNHDFLMTQLGKKIRDKAVLKLIAQYLRAGVVEDGHWQATREGVPQGGPLSPLLSNVVLDLLDKELEKRGHAFARWADDFVILVHSQRAGERVLASITRFIERRLKLKVNDQKSHVAPIRQCKFLGFSFHGNSLVWHPKVLDKFKREVRALTSRSQGKSVEAVIRNLSVYLRGWINYFGIAKSYQKCIDLDQWIRRRLRMYLWKQWRRARTRVRHLLALGVPTTLAICCGASEKSYWRSAKTEGIHRAITNEHLEGLGLVSLRDRWVEIHYG
ncbi:MAG: group II intron reverse transcriptase/maturase [Pseudomonadota bacterium]